MYNNRINAVTNMGEMVEGRQIGSHRLSPRRSPFPVKGGICVDGYGRCNQINDDFECKYRCDKAWESFHPQGACERSPIAGVGTLCMCYHDCP